MSGELPEDGDPAKWLRAIDETERERHRLLEDHAARELDGEAATLRRSLDEALGHRAPLLIEVGPGQVLELTPGEETP